MARVVGWIEAENGRLWRAEVRFEDPQIIFAERHRPATRRVHFKLHAQPGLLVPDHMEEWFFDSVQGSRISNGRHRNFRRLAAAER